MFAMSSSANRRPSISEMAAARAPVPDTNATYLDGLNPEQREMIEKAYLGDLTHHQIRDLTGLPLGTIKSRIRLGLDRLRHELKSIRDP